MPICAAEVTKSDEGLKILELNRLFHTVVEIEKRCPLMEITTIHNAKLHVRPLLNVLIVAVIIQQITRFVPNIRIY